MLLQHENFNTTYIYSTMFLSKNKQSILSSRTCNITTTHINIMLLVYVDLITTYIL